MLSCQITSIKWWDYNWDSEELFKLELKDVLVWPTGKVKPILVTVNFSYSLPVLQLTSNA